MDPVEWPVIVKFNKKDKSELEVLIRAITAFSLDNDIDGEENVWKL